MTPPTPDPADQLADQLDDADVVLDGALDQDDDDDLVVPDESRDAVIAEAAAQFRANRFRS